MEFSYNRGMVESEKDLAYDLRQIYAKIVGEHLQDIALARKSDKYHIYYKALKDLHIIVSHKIKDDKKAEKSEKEYYNDLIKKTVEVANKHPQEWLCKSSNPEACAEIEQALNKIEMFLYKKIDDAKMFGGGGKIPGL